MMQEEQQFPVHISYFNNGSGGRNVCGAWMPEDEARALWEDAIAFGDEEEEQFPPFTGQEYIDNHSSIDDHPYSTAFGQFLGNGIDADTANLLAFGVHSAISDISDDFEHPLRQAAVNIFDRLSDMGYWADSEDLERDEPEDFSTGYDLDLPFGA